MHDQSKHLDHHDHYKFSVKQKSRNYITDEDDSIEVIELLSQASDEPKDRGQKPPTAINFRKVQDFEDSFVE